MLALYGVIANDVSDYINLLVWIAHIICNHTLFRELFKDDYMARSCNMHW